ncbi:MAG: 50S ribosomal protein L11 methyltransferase [Flavobacteriales bacterium]|nr:50S ribosomal protein L11 methyltransferase [Flavobacteriales bacterium]
MNYIELSIKLKEPTFIKDVIIFELGELGFDSFQELDDELKAFISEQNYDPTCLALIKTISGNSLSDLQVINHPSTNWNKKWESNFKPIEVNSDCIIRSSFHKVRDVKYDVIIDPSMTFGTGHHETTLLMSKALFDLKLIDKDVLDMGTGTGVLAIICHLLGAKSVDAVDIDPIAVENTRKNLFSNTINSNNVFLGDSSFVKSNEYDLLLANINKNILLKDLSKYYKGLRKGGNLLLSGFFTLDNQEILDLATNIGLIFVDSKELNKWSLLILSK